MPTASSAQVRNSSNKMTTKSMVLDKPVFTYLITSSIASPVPRSNIAAITKSESVQFTSFVNCMAIKGMLKIKAVAISIILILNFDD